MNTKYKVDTVVTHTSPSFCELLTKAGLMGWAKRDDTLFEAAIRSSTGITVTSTKDGLYLPENAKKMHREIGHDKHLKSIQDTGEH